MVEDALDVLGKDVQPFRRDDHFFLPAADEQLAVGAELADVAGMKPSTLERASGLAFRVEVAVRHVLAAYEDLAVAGDFHLDARDGFSDRSALGAKRMIEAHDRRRFRQAVPLNHGEPDLTPERFELGLERRRADDEGPELQAEQAVNAAVSPPAAGDVLLGAGRPGLGGDPQHVFAQHIENLRHRHEDRHAPALDERDDLAWVVPAHEDDDARQHRRDEGRQGLTEHVAQRQQVRNLNGKNSRPHFRYFSTSRSMGTMFASTLRCVMSTPLGSAVAPDVKMISATSSAPMSTTGGAPSFQAMSCRRHAGTLTCPQWRARPRRRAPVWPSRSG